MKLHMLCYLLLILVHARALPVLGQSEKKEVPDLKTQVKAILAELNDENNIQVKPVGYALQLMPDEAVPIMKAELEAEGHNWVARVALKAALEAKGEKFEVFQHFNNDMSFEFKEYYDKRFPRFRQAYLDSLEANGALEGPHAELLKKFAEITTSYFTNVVHVDGQPDMKALRKILGQLEKAGCEDPLFFYVKRMIRPKKISMQYLNQRLKYMRLMLNSKHSDWIKHTSVYNTAAAWHDFYHYGRQAKRVDDAYLKAMRECMDALEPLTGAHLDAPVDDLDNHNLLYSKTVKFWESCGDDFDQRFDATLAVLKKKRDDNMPYLIAGRMLRDRAFLVRGSGFARNVKADAWPEFRQRMKESREFLEKAWRITPNDPIAATMMLQVCLADFQGRKELDQWFERAMEIDHNNAQALGAYTYALEPKWHGDRETYLKVIKQALMTGNHDKGKLTYFYLMGQLNLAKYHGNRYGQNIPQYYIANPDIIDDYIKAYSVFMNNETISVSAAGLIAITSAWANHAPMAYWGFNYVEKHKVNYPSYEFMSAKQYRQMSKEVLRTLNKLIKKEKEKKQQEE